MDTMVASPTNPSGALKDKLDAAWDKVEQEKALDFFKRAVTPRTTIAELMHILTYEKVSAPELGNVTIADIVRVSEKSNGKVAPAKEADSRFRTAKEDIDREQSEILAVLKAHPGIGREQLARKVRSKLTNRNMSHVTYLLRLLSDAGKVLKSGEKRGTVYQVV